MDEAALQLVDFNMAMANYAYLGTSELGDVAEDRHAWLWCCGLPAPDFNLVLPKTPIESLASVLERGQAFFEGRQLPWRLMLREEHALEHAAALAAAGFEELPGFPAMILDPAPATLPQAPPGLELREVASPQELSAFRTTAFVGFGLPAELGPKFITAGFAARPGSRLCLGFLGEEPVCTAATLVTGDWIGIYWVATLPEHRGRGFGAAATWAAIAAGRRLGGAPVCLQASELGRPVYERMGFTTPTHYVKFKRVGGD